MSEETTAEDSAFGKHMQRLRRARKMTQEQLAECSDLAADTIRRLEHSDFSPSLRTLRKVCVGMNISLSTLFVSFEMPRKDPLVDELVGLLDGRNVGTLQLVTRVITEVLAAVDER